MQKTVELPYDMFKQQANSLQKDLTLVFVSLLKWILIFE